MLGGVAYKSGAAGSKTFGQGSVKTYFLRKFNKNKVNILPLARHDKIPEIFLFGHFPFF